MTTSISLPPLEWSGPPADGYRLLARVPADGVTRSLSEHRRHAPPPPAPRRRPRSELLDSIEQSGLRGHGGAGFPTGTKLRAVAAQG
ncbi:MAG TPA: hypothetical protein VHP57_01980, partial [Acidimicrobiia bacterium]|nr:hypothetical protein [Acidimicrobiia bacterium]